MRFIQGIFVCSISMNALNLGLQLSKSFKSFICELLTECLLYVKQNLLPIQRKTELRYGKTYLTLTLSFSSDAL
jgi:hypothetical protein